MDVLRQLISLEPLIVLSLAIGFGSLARKLKAGSFVLGGPGSQVSHCVVATTPRSPK
jgi:hypothetical protein